jgi:5-methylcytosine-specific restriction protein A
MVLASHPLCAVCDEPATDVDHIDGNARNNDVHNLQSLCHSCHSRKTARQDGGFGRPPRDN